MGNFDQLFVIGGGWVYYLSPDLSPPRTRTGVAVFVGFEERDARLVPIQLQVKSPGTGVNTDLMRQIPLGRIEAWVNSPATARVVRADLAETGPLTDPDHSRGQAAWDEYYAAPPGESERGFEVFLEPISIPASRDYGDDFYQEVARAYTNAVQLSHRPAVHIAQTQEVPVATVHRWISESRRRGFLPPGRPGKAG